MYKLLLYVIEPLVSLLEQVGIKDWLWKKARSAWTWAAGAAVAAAGILYGAYLYLWELTPVWAIPILIIVTIGVLCTTLLSILWIFLRTWLLLQDFRHRINLTDIAEDIDRKAAEMAEYYESLADANDLYNPQNSNDPSSDRQIEMARQRRVAAKFYARYSGQLLANHKKLQNLGVPVPWHIGVSASDNPKGIIIFHRYAATLIKQGRIEDAKTLDDRTGFSLLETIMR